MKKRGISKMYLVAMRPFGGWTRASFAKTARGNLLALTSITQNVINRLSPTGRFYFSVIVSDLKGNVAEMPEFKQLVSNIETTSSFKLILKIQADTNVDTVGIDGALVPQKDI